jgi:hypothetical protein
MDLQSMFSDNQIAVMGCFAALGVCGVITGLSFQFGPAGRKSQQSSSMNDAIHPIRPGRTVSSETATADETRRAA